MRHTAFAAAMALALTLGACNDQPDEALPPEGELEGALPADDMAGDEEFGDEPDLEPFGEPATGGMESGANPPGATAPTQGSKLQKADPQPQQGSKLQRADPDY